MSCTDKHADCLHEVGRDDLCELNQFTRKFLDKEYSCDCSQFAVNEPFRSLILDVIIPLFFRWRPRKFWNDVNSASSE
ncbi:hypothetical protein Pfo_013760 [Paulownia fortunei]|nr:hypothetical protein Pfo_013760 [Paulownia fortunei]